MRFMNRWFEKEKPHSAGEERQQQGSTRKTECQGVSQKRVQPVPSKLMGAPGDGLSVLVNSPAREIEASGPWEVGQTVDERYEVKEILGHGGMGIVYRVHHTGWDIDLAVKCVLEGQRSNAEVVEGFLHEADRWIHLGLHPNVVSAHYVRKYGDPHYIFLEYVPGVSLRDLLDRGTELTWEQKLDIAIQLCRGIQHCHDKGMLHRDIKPENILVVPGETGDLVDTKITDFGLVRQQAARLTGAKGIDSAGKSLRGYGTPGYMAPELFRDPNAATPASDAYALGIVFCEIFNGSHPLGQHAPEEWKHIHQDAEPELGQMELPGEIAERLQECLHKLPEERPHLNALAESFVHANEGGYARSETKEAELLADALNNQALSYIDLGKTDEAVDLLKAALNIDPEHIDATYNYGLIRWRKGLITDHDLCSRIESLSGRKEEDEATIWCLKEIDTERGHYNVPTCHPEHHNMHSQSDPNLQYGAESRGRILKSFYRHESPVRAVGGSSVKQCIISGDALGVLRVWDIKTGECLRRIKAHRGAITGICVTSSGCNAVTSSKDAVLKLWQLPQGTEAAEVGPLNGSVTALSLTKDGTCVLAATQGGYICYVYRWSLRDPASIKVLCEEKCHEVSSLSIDPTGKRFILGMANRELLVKDLETGETETSVKHIDRLTSKSLIIAHPIASGFRLTPGVQLQEIGSRVEDYVASCFGPAGKSFLSGWRDGTVKCWLLDQISRYGDTCPPSLRGHAGPISAIRFSSDEKTAFSAGADRTIRQYQLGGDENRVLFTYHGHTDVVNDLCILNGGRQFVSGGEDGKVFLWEGVSPESSEPASFSMSRPVSSIRAVSTELIYRECLSVFWSAMRVNDFAMALNTARRIRTMHGCQRRVGAIKCWRSLYAHLARISFCGRWQMAQIKPPPADTSFMRCACYVRDKDRLIHGKTLMPKHWSVQDWGGLDQQTFNGVMGLWIDSAGNTLLAAYADGQVYVYRSDEKQTLFSEHISETKSTALCLAAKGTNCIYLGQRGGGMLRVGRSGWQQIDECDGHSNDVTSLSMSRDGTSFASGSRDGTVKLWNAKTSRCIKTLEAECGDINSVAITSGIGETVVCAAEFGVLAWDTISGSHWKVRGEAKVEASCVAACPDGNFVLLGDAEGVVEMWDIAEQCRLSALAVSSAAITALSFIDQDYGLFGTTKGTVGLLRLNPIKCIEKFRCHTDWVSALAVSQDGGLVFSGGYDGIICVTFLDWALDTSDDGNGL